MPRPAVNVTCRPTDPSQLPDDLAPAAVQLLDLSRRGGVDQVGQRLHIRRQGGYCGLDVWILLLLYFLCRTRTGIKKFWKTVGVHSGPLAALAGRRSLASPPALSRALEAAENDLVREVSPWLLWGPTGIDEVMLHPAMQSYDTHGVAWHVFDLDPTVTALRQRALPADEDLPEPRRRSADTGAPGHRGRKRGEIVFRRVTVQHSGSAAFVHMHCSPGNGEGVVDLERALGSVQDTCGRLTIPTDRSLVRMDGEHGYVPWFTTCRERKQPFVTRLNRPKLYEDPKILRGLREATWHQVPDSLSGPRRSAADLGIVRISPGERTRRSDGSRYAGVHVRVVASIFPNAGEATHGRIIDGWQVELFAADLPADAWPAREVVALYFGRSAEENRFAQEDRELGLDRIISYHLPGQELACVIGLSVWNLKLAQGFRQAPPPHVRPPQQPRCPVVDDRIPPGWPRDPMVMQLLGQMDWPRLLTGRPGLRFDEAAGELRCEDGRPLTPTTVRPREHAPGRTGVIFRRPTGGCDDCPSDTRCLASARPHAPKHAEFSLPTPLAVRLRKRLAQIRSRPADSPSLAPERAAAGPLAATESLFLAAAARHLFDEVFAGASMRITLELPPPPEPKPRLLADDVPDRQRRRKTWAQNVDRYALPDGATVTIDVAGSAALRELLDGAPRRTRAAGRSG